MWTDVAMVVLTAASLIAAGVAVAAAKRSNSTAGQALVASEQANKLSNKANAISEVANNLAKESNELARSARIDIAWDELIAAVSSIQTFDPASGTEPIGDRVARIRVRETLLIDLLDWPGFDTWVGSEHQFGVTLMREASEVGQREVEAQHAPLSPYRAIEIDRHFHTWLAAYVNNLRLFRRGGANASALTSLTEVARTHTATVCSRNGWPLPPTDIPGVMPLDDPAE